ncbi:MAG: hypothetical protein A3I66_16460 [Burkholderiales bacterium RIFCSPLOWO2_02_FULL_57_36]|nr:MAG: hypothetical protein A3I66_16460 [Burkholderiales bacterium RIFCSPLOWO2_02_FULL_57_36]
MFSKSGAEWVGDADVNDRITAAYAADGTTIIGWSYVSARGDVTERYDATGLLVSITARAGTTQRMTYSNGITNDTQVGRSPVDAPGCSNVQAGAVLPAGRLLCVTDHWGRQLQFEYDIQGRIVKAIDPIKQSYFYEYDGPSGGCLVSGDSNNRACSANNLTKVTYPVGKSKIYYYNESAYINGGTACINTGVVGNGFGGLVHQLTGIADENGVRYSSWTFDCQGRTTSNELAGGVGKVTLTYSAWNADSATATVTHYLGTPVNPQTTIRNYAYQKLLGIAKNAGIDQPCAECGPIKDRIYDANGNVASHTDFNGNVTKYGYDLSRNLETSRVEAFGSSYAKTITTQWHPTYRLPTKIAEPLRITTKSYDAKGNLLSKTVQATSDATGAQSLSAPAVGTARVWAYTYNDIGQVLTAIGPRTDLDDTTRYAYDAATGNLVTVTNAAGHVTTLSHYDANGRVGKIVDANGLTTDMTYSPRGWLTSRTVTGNGSAETTGYEYDGVGQLKKVTLPDGSWIGYDYDDAHRLTDTYDSLGNRISYTLDAMGNRLKEQVTDPAGALARQTTRVYDALNRLQAVTGAGP